MSTSQKKEVSDDFHASENNFTAWFLLMKMGPKNQGLTKVFPLLLGTKKSQTVKYIKWWPFFIFLLCVCDENFLLQFSESRHGLTG